MAISRSHSKHLSFLLQSPAPTSKLFQESDIDEGDDDNENFSTPKSINNKPCAAELPKSDTIPLTLGYPKVVNETIYSYTSSVELKKHFNSDFKPFNAKTDPQKPTESVVNDSWRSLINKLLETLKEVPGTTMPELSYEPEEDVYRSMCSKNRQALYKFIEMHIDAKDQAIKQKQALLRDCILHIVIDDARARNEKEEVFSFDYEFINRFLLTPRDSYLFLDMLLANGIKINCDEQHWYFTICNAILNNTPVKTLTSLIEHGIEAGHFKRSAVSPGLMEQLATGFGYFGTSAGKKLPEGEGFYTTPLLLALISSKDQAIIRMLIDKFPDEVFPTIEALNKIKAGPGLMPYIEKLIYHVRGTVSSMICKATKGSLLLQTALSYNVDNINSVAKAPADLKVYGLVSADPDLGTKAKIELLRSIDNFEQKEQVTVSSKNKQEIFKILKEEINRTSTPECCSDLYQKHINACYINNHYWAKLDFIVCSLWSTASTYTNTKKLFIEALRAQIYEIVIQDSYKSKFATPVSYLEACKKVLSYPIFADEHDKQGVNKVYKNSLNEYIKSFEAKLIEAAACLKGHKKSP